MDHELAMRIGTEVRRARTQLRLTQQDAAERVGVSVEFYARIERGGTLPSVPTLQRLSTVLRTPSDVLLGSPSAPALVAHDSGGSPMDAADDERGRLLRRIVRRLDEADRETLTIVNQLLVGFDKLKSKWVAARKRR